MGKVRRSGRIAKEIRILLLGTDSCGTFFAEETRTVTLSRHGAGIISKHKLALDGLLIMRFSGGSAETAIRLVGQLGQDGRGFVYGVAFVDEEEDFWELEFPPPPVWNGDLDGRMQCECCKRYEVVSQSEIEADVLALSESILRYCSYCATPTVWRATAEEVSVSAWAPESATAGAELAAGEMPPEPAPPSRGSAVVAKRANRRRDVRTRVSLSACIRFGASEEIVECANLSKRGFAFRSRTQYPVGGEIEVAVPFYPGTPPSFVTGSVRHVTALANYFQYGVMYARMPAHDKSTAGQDH